MVLTHPMVFTSKVREEQEEEKNIPLPKPQMALFLLVFPENYHASPPKGQDEGPTILKRVHP